MFSFIVGLLAGAVIFVFVPKTYEVAKVWGAALVAKFK